MENLLLDFLAEVVRHRTDEHTLCQRGNLARRDKAVHLGGDGGGHVVAVDGDGLPFLQDFAEALGERLGCLAHHLSGEDVADGVDDDLRLLVGIVADELREVLKAQQHGHLVATRGGDKVIQPLDEHGGQLIDDDGAFQPALLVHQFDDARVVQSERRPVDGLPVGVVADAEHLRLVGVVDVEGELVGGHHPIERRGNHARERYLGRSNLPHELVGSPGEPCVEERAEVVLQFGIGGHDGENLLVGLVQELDRMGEGAILSVFVNA